MKSEYTPPVKDTRTICSIPTYERIKQLWALGHSNSTISAIISHEMGDIETGEVKPGDINRLVALNRDDFENTRAKLGLYCQDAIRKHVAVVFNQVQGVEQRMVVIYAEKLDKVLSQLAELDLDEKDEDGNFCNTSRFFILYEMADKLQGKISKIVGTDALREVEAYKMKLSAKVSMEGPRIIPDYNSEQKEVTTNFI